MTDPLDGFRDASPVRPPTTPRVSAFVLLPEDLLVEILLLLDVRHILSLRQVCKALAQATRIRSLWVHLADREALNRKLLWPTYAFPLTFVPTGAIEKHTLRALSVERQWVRGMRPQRRGLARCIFQPPNSIGWLRIIKGRWLALELREQHLDLWDLQDELASEPVASYHGLKGTINGSSITISEGPSIDLPHFGECGPIPNFVQLDTFEGYSGLLDLHAGLAVFSHSAPNKTPLVRDIRTGLIVLLGGSEVTERFQQRFTARILKEYIILIGLSSMEAYAITEVHSLMRNGREGPLPKVVHPVQSFGYPGEETAQHVEVLDPPSGPSKHDLVNRESQLYLGIHLDRSANWTRLHVRLDSDSSSATFTSSAQRLFNTRVLRPFACCWGESGEKILLATWYGTGWRVLCTVPQSVPDPPSPACGFGFSALWDASPKLEQDFFAGFAFDEASGICAIATSAGRVWIDDYSKPPVSSCKLLEEGLHLEEIHLHPDPSWPVLHPIPYPANVNRNLSMSDLTRPIPWSTEVEHYFPMMNDPNCYGGAQWFVNEALHVSGAATLVMFTTSALYPRKCWSTRIIRVTGGRLIAVETNVEMQSRRVKLLEPNITLTQVPSLISEEPSIEGVAGVDLDVDYAVVRRYAFWRKVVEGERWTVRE
ncbi:hypothetical protein FRC00_003293 [Tulasnella sp. 408]|nr:hypothetical protein FRC00_003293 [Tulasnella sp. 408]